MQIKSCPFCGCGDRRVGIRRMGNKGYRVVCGKCGSTGPHINIADHETKSAAQEVAIEKWNRRVWENEQRGIYAGIRRVV